MWQNLKTQTFYKLKTQILKKPKKSNFEKVLKNLIVNTMNKNQKLEFGPYSTESLTNPKTQILIKFT